MKIFKSVIVSLVSSLFTAIALAYLYQFPVYGAGYIGPITERSTYIGLDRQAEILGSVIGTWFGFGVLGFYVAIAGGGLIAGVASKKFMLSSKFTFYLAAGLGALPMLFLAFYWAFEPLIIFLGKIT